ncbi:MAG: hypothetical protein KAS12_05010 [Candidatus Aenigmarchaeota archaeon]|nr:hypothetical protein [Candidatus Aenigmarchaeota archaeon]
MNEDQWENLVFRINKRFGIEQQQTEEFIIDELPNGKNVVGQRQIVEFSGLNGAMRLIRETRPKVLEKKAFYSRRMGATAVEKYVYSEDETVSAIKAEQKDTQGNWQRISLQNTAF